MPFMTTLGCSVVAGGLGAIIGTPADAALIRMQADSTLPEAQRRNYKNGLDAMLRMLREEGLSGFFSGAGPTVVRGLAINVGMLSTYGDYKKFFGPYLDGVDGQGNRFFSGFMSGWTAATVALPFDYVKTMIQKQKPDPKTGALPYSVLHALLEPYRESSCKLPYGVKANSVLEIKTRATALIFN